MSKWYLVDFPFSGDNDVTRAMTWLKISVKVITTNQNYKTEISVNWFKKQFFI